ncbi:MULTISPECIES: PAS domain-containing protein [unclassified Bradyrhizobium]|uniref:PAS domain-containing protein n=1 Tax=unclassified Bradyrhizobium TaxID=2631580 RepID=UPI001BA79C44|nr:MULTISPECIES: PAS domain-containing protein [unclassified Bradyrhizobium]MBR1205166.1 PAS domain-containing protein [Bradyrhizobium sp. AUGA SZCCT0124]MBR1312245.1 PAS domain-containing protein [Bradyrhizobium sp. AUGA SZCCT0051]MBR1342136.1 PAS domain-containing protein [Bradyrhizobium sp. AUGA SZCCT0105]MBR1358927.1 PAS domain-containing protein [Bradyrhizobium sp. AUGA SZCCT0045]
MKRFICEQNVAHFSKLLKDARDSTQKTTLERLLARENRELAMLDAAQVGADVASVARQPRRSVDASRIREQFLSDFDHSLYPYLLLDPGPGLLIVDVNAAYATATLTQRNDILGRSLFDVFPDNPDHPFADGVSNLYNSLKTVAKTGRPHAMSVQRYDIKGPAGDFVERYWQPINTPIHDTDGRLVFLLHHVEGVSDQVTRPSSMVSQFGS